MHVELKVLNKEFYRAKNGIENNSSKSLCYGNLPSYATPGGAALDLVCCEDVSIYPGEVKAIHTGLAIWIGATKVLAGMTKCSFAGIISPRSGLGTKGLILANTIGVIDEDYQGELIVQALNDTAARKDAFGCGVREIITIEAGDRFAQLLFLPVVKVQWNVVNEFSNKTDRSTGSFGSTGV